MPFEAVAIRPVTHADAAFIDDLAREVFSRYSRDPVGAIRAILQVPGAIALIAEMDSQPVGFVVVQHERLPRDFGPWSRPVRATINAIAVDARARRLGAGHHLLEGAEQAVRRLRGESCRSLSLATAETNTRARRLFEQHGFTRLARLASYYTQGQAAVWMHKALLG